MARNILVLLLTIYLSIKCATAQTVEYVSLVEQINFEHKDDEWTCGNATCPQDTYGCKFVAHTFEEKVLYYAYNCMDKDRKITEGEGYKILLVEAKQISIRLDTFVGAVSDYDLDYDAGGLEYAVGIVALDDLHKLKEEFKKMKDEIKK